MKFIDSVKVYLQGGKGGDGCLSFRRERFRPKGGPDGGDGGRGGNVILASDAQMTSLIDLSYHPRLIAEDGQRGGRNNQSGRSGKDLIVPIPLGTLVIDSETGRMLQDFDEGQKRFIGARGGHGGRGNAQFATAVRQTPRRTEKGEQGEQQWLRLELKLVVDVGLVGLPNSGKSLLISKISSARPRVADYSFTTTSPNLGVVTDDDMRSFTVADMPGLIKNANQGSGLGTQFLRHMERAQLLVHVLDITRLPAHSLVDDYGVVMEELRAFNTLFEKKRQIIAINKVDLVDSLRPLRQTRKAFAERGIPTVFISALKGQGLPTLIHEIWQQLEQSRIEHR